MRLPRVRFTVRRLMIVVAVVAIGVHSVRFARKSYRNYHAYRTKIVMLRTLEPAYAKLAESANELDATIAIATEQVYSLDDRDFETSSIAQGKDQLKSNKEHVEWCRQIALDNKRLIKKYEAAVRRPWLDVEPD
jgi:uncharacterized protein YdcH (DUF465 family)